MNNDKKKLKKGKRDEIIKKKRNFIENKFVNRQLEKGGGGPCYERLWLCRDTTSNKKYKILLLYLVLRFN
jgi:hypothetical protein